MQSHPKIGDYFLPKARDAPDKSKKQENYPKLQNSKSKNNTRKSDEGEEVEVELEDDDQLVSESSSQKSIDNLILEDDDASDGVESAIIQ